MSSLQPTNQAKWRLAVQQWTGTGKNGGSKYFVRGGRRKTLAICVRRTCKSSEKKRGADRERRVIDGDVLLSWRRITSPS